MAKLGPDNNFTALLQLIPCPLSDHIFMGKMWTSNNSLLFKNLELACSSFRGWKAWTNPAGYVCMLQRWNRIHIWGLKKLKSPPTRNWNRIHIHLCLIVIAFSGFLGACGHRDPLPGFSENSDRFIQVAVSGAPMQKPRCFSGTWWSSVFCWKWASLETLPNPAIIGVLRDGVNFQVLSEWFPLIVLGKNWFRDGDAENAQNVTHTFWAPETLLQKCSKSISPGPWALFKIPDFSMHGSKKVIFQRLGRLFLDNCLSDFGPCRSFMGFVPPFFLVSYLFLGCVCMCMCVCVFLVFWFLVVFFVEGSGLATSPRRTLSFSFFLVVAVLWFGRFRVSWGLKGCSSPNPSFFWKVWLCLDFCVF